MVRVLGDSGGVGSALKEDMASSLLAEPMVKTEQAESIFVVDVEITFRSEPKKNIFASASTSTPDLIFPLSRYSHATHAVLTFLRAPHDFDPLQEFQLHLEENYRSFRLNQMQ